VINPAQRSHVHSLHRPADGPRSIYCFFSDSCTDVARDRAACTHCQHFILSHELGPSADAPPASTPGEVGSRAA
jgi:hypothetical protein